jgi:hypothetical protein
MNEAVKIDGFPDYSIDKEGNIFNRHGRIIKGYINNKGYRCVQLSRRSQIKGKLVHRLLGLMFICNHENKPQINHIDGNKLNNSLSNLEWVTGEENAIHAYQLGLKVGLVGEKNPASKLNEKEVLEIVEALSDDFEYKEIAAFYKVSLNLIREIAIGRGWVHVTGIVETFPPYRKRA